MAYSSYDFTASMERAGISLSSIDRVIAAWGNTDKDGACCDECGGEWTGGLLVALKDAQFAYVTGWCDYTGWGCQDGASVMHFAAEPELGVLDGPPATSWDKEPADCNKELA